jgi:hypothetical protein
MTVEAFDRLLENQGGRCAVCGEEERPGRRFRVDYNRSTGVIRGLVCRKCGKTVSFIQRRKTILMQAWRYLEQMEQNNA